MSKTQKIETPSIQVRDSFSTDTRVQTKFTQPSLTKSEFKDECDINNIVKKARITGMLPTGQGTPMYEDFTQIEDFTQVQQTIHDAENKFMQISSDIRARFHHNVAELLDFIDDPKNREEAGELGLLPKLPKSEQTLTTPIVENKSNEDSELSS